MIELKNTFKHILWRSSPNMYRRWSRPASQVFSIGVVAGESPFDLKNSKDLYSPVLTRHDVKDVPAAFVADPFMCRVNDQWYMFFEVANQLNHRGEIGLAVSKDAVEWEYKRIVLTEPHHLSYPYVFEWLGEFYMIPESTRGGAVTLYKAMDFPERWVRQGNLLEGQRYADSSIFRHDSKWWLFTDAGSDSINPVLRLYFSSDLMGTWNEHPESPILENNRHISRPGGRVIKVGDTLVRFAQDVFPIYGSQVQAFQIIELSETVYVERETGAGPVLAAGANNWNRGGMHHIDAHELANGTWIACVDGFENLDISSR